jgi:hypothetical protein
MSNYTVKEVLYSRSYNNDPPTNAHEFIHWLKQIVEKAPIGYRGTVWIEIDAHTEYDSACLDIEIGYDRPETEAEIKRKDDMRARAVAYDIAHAKATLAKYGVAE